MTVGPWDHRLKDVGVYELRFAGAVQIELMFTRPPDMAATLVREMCAGMNDGYRRRHPDVADDGLPADTGGSAAGGDDPTGQGAESGSLPPKPADPTPPQWRETANTVEEAAEWIAKVHAVDRRTYWNGAGLAHQAYLDEVSGRHESDAA